MPVLSTFPRLFRDIDNEPVSTAVMSDYVSRAAAELEEAKLQQKITETNFNKEVTEITKKEEGFVITNC